MDDKARILEQLDVVLKAREVLDNAPKLTDDDLLAKNQAFRDYVKYEDNLFTELETLREIILRNI